MSDKTFIGLPIEGTEAYTVHRSEQEPDELFEDALKALFEFDGVEAVRWMQYTPHFNDGTTCIFGIHGWSIKVEGVASETSYDGESGFLGETDPSWAVLYGGTRYLDYTSETRRWNSEEIEAETADLATAMKTFDARLQSGTHENLLLKAFGDHAQVTVERGRITLESYEHD